MELKKYIKQKNYRYYVIATLIILLLFPYVLRFLNQGSFIVPGDNSYNHLSLAEQSKDYSLFNTINDSLIHPSRAKVITPYHVILNQIAKVIPINVAVIILSLLLGIITIILFNAILKRFKLLYFQRFAIIMVLVLSPLFLNTFLIPEQTFFIIFMQILAFYLYTRKDNLKYISVFPYLLLSFFSIFHTFIALLLILVYEQRTNKNYKFPIILSVCMLGITAYINIPIYFIYGFLKIQLPKENLFQYYITDLGSSAGFGVFTIILFVFGTIKTWKDKYSKNYIMVYTLLCAFLALSYLYPPYLPYLNFIVMIFSGLGFLFLFEMKWDLRIIKNFTIFIIILGLLFSGISYSKRVSTMSPTPELIESFDFLKEKYSDAIILTDPSYGHMIKYYARSEVIIDSSPDFIEDYEYYIKGIDLVFQSRSLKSTTKFLDKYNINIILITKEMKKGLVWTRENQGLLFLMENSQKFKLIHHRPDIEIWEYTS
jgi:hypothetical protein